MIMEINWLELATQVAIVLALVNWVKALSKDKLGHYAMLVSMGFAFVVVFLATMPEPIVWYSFVRDSVIVGLTACGLFDLRKGD